MASADDPPAGDRGHELLFALAPGQVPGAAIVTYNAPGTWLVDDSAVRYEAFQATVGQPKEVSEAATHLFTPNQIAKTNKWHLYLETKQKMEASDSNHLSVGGRGHLLKHEYFYAYV